MMWETEETGPEMARTPLLQGVVRAALFDKDFYREVAASPGATGYALVIVILASIATGVGVLTDGWEAVLRGGIIVGLIGWFLWTSLAFLIGAKLLAVPATNATWIKLGRALGFAQAPGILRVLGLVPETGLVISLIGLVWVYLAMTVAVREVLSFDSLWRAAAVMVLGLVPFVAIEVGLLLLTGGP